MGPKNLLCVVISLPVFTLELSYLENWNLYSLENFYEENYYKTY